MEILCGGQFKLRTFAGNYCQKIVGDFFGEKNRQIFSAEILSEMWTNNKRPVSA
jgi:hypothetical protein